MKTVQWKARSEKTKELSEVFLKDEPIIQPVVAIYTWVKALVQRRIAGQQPVDDVKDDLLMVHNSFICRRTNEELMVHEDYDLFGVVGLGEKGV